MKKILASILLFGLIFGISMANAEENRSTLLARAKMRETTACSILLQGPTTKWFSGTVIQGEISIPMNSTDVPSGRYVITLFGFDRYTNSTITATTEALLTIGQNVVVLQYTATSFINEVIVLPEVFPLGTTADVEVYDANGVLSMLLGNMPIVPSDTGSLVSLWFPSCSGKIKIKIGNVEYIADDPIGQIINNGQIVVAGEEQSTGLSLKAEAYNGLLYPTDFPSNMSLETAISSLKNGDTIKIANDTGIGQDITIMAKSITIEGDPSFSAQIFGALGDNRTTITVLPNPNDPEAEVTFRYMRLSNFNLGDNSAVINKTTAIVILDHCLLESREGAAVEGEPGGLWMYHCTVKGYDENNLVGSAFNLIGHGVGYVENSLFVGFQNLLTEESSTDQWWGNSNLVWNIANANVPPIWSETSFCDPLLGYFGPKTDSPVVGAANDGSYLGAQVPKE